MVNSKPFVSIIIPVYNEGYHILKCLKALKRQTYPNIEIIVVDNGSDDNTVEIARKYADKVIIEKRKGITYAKNTGIESAGGDFVAMTDADCIPQPKWIEELLIQFTENKIASVGGPNITPEDASSFAVSVGKLFEFLSRFGIRYASHIKQVTDTYHNPGCNVMYRREIFSKVGKFNESLLTVEDEELDYRILKAGYRIVYTPVAKVLHYRRLNWQSFARQIYRYGIGRMQAMKIQPLMIQWFRVVPIIAILLLILTPLFSIKWFEYVLILYIGVDISLSFYLAIKTGMKFFYNYLLLFPLCCLSWTFGFIRGFWGIKKDEHSS